MADFRYLVKRAIAVPPHVAAWKTVKWIARETTDIARNQAQKFVDPYCKAENCASLSGFLPEFDAETKAQLAALSLDDLLSNDIAHRFNLLGSGFVSVAYAENPDDPAPERLPPGARRTAAIIRRSVSADYTPIDWFRDARAGYRWPEKGSGTKKVAPVPWADIKWPWELGRLQHFPRLALACLNRKAKALARDPLLELNDQLADFRAAAPPGHGVPWSCTMDVAIRAANLALAFSILEAGRIRLDLSSAALWSESLHDHADFISKNLEWVPDLRGNHYLCDLAGLLLAAAVLPAGRLREQYLSLAVTELEKETDLQFQSDGSNFEGSVCYHRLSMDTLAWTALVLQRLCAEEATPDAYQSCLSTLRHALDKAATFSDEIMGPNGHVPQIGDNDSGRFVEFRPDLSDTDHRRSVRLARISAGTPCAADSVSDDPALILAATLAPTGETQPSTAPATVSRFADFGLYVRRWPGIALTFRCGPVGQRGNGGHDHNDQLSVTVTTGDGVLIADPGTFTYTAAPDERNRFRSANAHACFSVTGREPNTWHDGLYGLFSLKTAHGGTVTACDDTVFEGAHDGYVTPCTRRIRFEPDGVRVSDTLHLTATKRLCLPLGPQVDVTVDGSTARLILGQRVFVAHLEGDLEWSLEPGFYSPAYGVKVDAWWLSVETERTGVSWSLTWDEPEHGRE